MGCIVPSGCNYTCDCPNDCDYNVKTSSRLKIAGVNWLLTPPPPPHFPGRKQPLWQKVFQCRKSLPQGKIFWKWSDNRSWGFRGVIKDVDIKLTLHLLIIFGILNVRLQQARFRFTDITWINIISVCVWVFALSNLPNLLILNSEDLPTGCYASIIHRQKCHTRGESQECISHTPLPSANNAEPTLTLKPRGDITRSPKQGYQWPHKWTCVQQKF